MFNSKNKVNKISEASKVSNGFSILEIILATGLFVIIISGAVGVVIQAFSSIRLGEEVTKATFLATEGLEAVRAIQERDFSLVTEPHSYGLDNTTGQWEFSDTQESRWIGRYFREIVISDVYRDGNDNIVGDGGALDIYTKKVEAVVTWDFSPTRSNTVNLPTYFTDWSREIIDWSSPEQGGSLNFAGSHDGRKVQVRGDYAYAIRSGGDPDFAVIDISDPDDPSFAGGQGTTNLPGSSRNIAISGDYAYVVSTHESQELQIVDVSTPSSPTVEGTFDADGDANAFGVYVVGTTAYLVRDGSGENELWIIDASTPGSPSSLGSLDLGADGNEIVVLGNYAYIASSRDSRELQVVDISDPGSLEIDAYYDLPGGSDAISITGFNDTVVLGRSNGDVYVFDVSTPTVPTPRPTVFNAHDDVRDLSLGKSNTLIFIASDRNSAEFQVVDISTLSLWGSLDMSADLNGVAYHEDKDRAFVVGDADNEEFSVITP